MREITIEELHVILLDIAKEFHRICKKHNIPYYMLGGTMLGAIRHKGFIPWDDDMDFGILDKDWKKCLEFLEVELPSYYQIRTMNNSDYILGRLIKIEDTRTVICEIGKENIKNDVLGINIDIFPLNFASKKKGFVSRNWWIEKLIKLQFYRFFSYKSCKFRKRLISVIVKMFFFPLKKNHITNFLNAYLIKQEGECLANYWGAWISKEIVPVRIMGTPCLYQFEGNELYGVESYDVYLKSLYNNYMELPPEEKRHFHIKNMYKK